MLQPGLLLNEGKATSDSAPIHLSPIHSVNLHFFFKYSLSLISKYVGTDLCRL